MPDQIERTLRSLERQLPGRVSRPGKDGFAAATAIWAKPVGRMPRAVVHCQTTEDVQLSIDAIAVFHCRCGAAGTIGPVVLCAPALSSTSAA